jgi:Ice-binding-like
MNHPLRIKSASLRLGLSVFTVGALTFAFGASPAWSATAPNLGTAAAASVVAGSTVTNTGSSVLSGDLDLYPGTAVTGFPPGQIGGTQHAGGPTGGPADVAANDVTNAYLQTQAAPTTAVMNTDLGGQSLTAGVYSASSSMSLTGTLTLVGTANSVFIFQAVSTLITAPGSRVVLSGGVQACNVFWQVGSSATIDTTTQFVGNILALASITMNHGATLEGRALAQNGAVTLDDNTISSPTCNVASPTTTTTTAATTTTTGAGPTTTTTAARGTTTTTGPGPTTTTTAGGSTTTTTTTAAGTTATSTPTGASTPTTTPGGTSPKSSPLNTTTTVAGIAGGTTTTAPPLLGAPITGGGPLRPTGSPWPLVGLLGMGFGGGLALYARSRTVQSNRRSQ